MRLPRLAILALVTSGCAVGGGTTTVGIWRPHRVVDTDVCIQETQAPGQGANTCTKTVQVARDIPERSFGGGVFAWFNPGYLVVTDDGEVGHRFAIDNHVEYLRGRGGRALGVRVGGNLAVGGDHFMFAVPVTVVGHWGQPRYSFYGGLGYTPYAFDQTTVNEVTTTRYLHGFNAMAGVRTLIKPGRSIQMTGALEIFQYIYFGDVTATSATASIGLHL